MKHLLTLSVVCSMAWAQSAEPPGLGSRFPISLRDGYVPAFAGGVRCPYVTRTYGGITFKLAVDPDEILVFISTQDPGFRTPDGLRVGATQDEALAAGGGAIIREAGFPPFSHLPSGWYALYPERPLNCFGFSLPNASETWRITDFFRRSSRSD